MALNPKNTAFSLDNALACANASLLAYSATPITQAAVATAFGRNVSEIVTFDPAGSDAKGFLALLDGAIAIVFRGTDSLANWIDDGEILLLPFRGVGSVHSGFMNSLNGAWPTIATTLARWKGGGRTLWIAGHSLGGALAALTAAYLRFPADPTTTTPSPIAGLYTFGQPRVGTRDFANACSTDFGNLHFRFVNNADIVPRIPPRLLGYWHSGDLEFIDGNGAIQSDISWWHEMLDMVEVGVSGLHDLQNKPQELLKIDAIADHSMTLYRDKIQAALPAAPAPVAQAAAAPSG